MTIFIYSLKTNYVLPYVVPFRYLYMNKTDAVISGADILLKYEMQEHISFTAKYARVRGNDRTQNIALINIPADNIFGHSCVFISRWQGDEK